MGMSTYVFEDLENYIKFYPKGTESVRETPIDGMVLTKHGVVIITSNNSKFTNPRPTLNRKLSVFYGGYEEFDRKYRTRDMEEVVGLTFNYKKNLLVFIGSSRDFEINISRYIGKEIKHNIKFFDLFKSSTNVGGYVLYDYERNRLNLILKPAMISAVP